MIVRPPFLYLFPDGSEQILTVPIPPLVSRSSYAGPSTPTGVISHPCPRRAGWGLVPLNCWQSTGIRPDISVSSHDYTMRFSSMDGQVGPPRYATQHLFGGISLTSINVVLPDGDAVVCQILPSTVTAGFELKVHAFPQNTEGHFLPSHSRTFAVRNIDWSHFKVHSGPICPVSGSMLLTRTGNWTSSSLLSGDSVTVAIASFD